MGKICWDFPYKGTGNEQSYTNSGIELFKGKELMENLAREICQNSLDAKIPSSSGPVVVKFQCVSIPQSDHELFADYKECIESCKENWAGRMDDNLRDFLAAADRMLGKQAIPVLVASDYNTKGLTGVDAGEDEESAWRALAHSDGVSAKSSDSSGSYGIGKDAPFACTALSMVFYNTYAIDGGRAFQGTARLATLKKNGKKTVGTGHYLFIDDSLPEEEENWRPIRESDNCSFFKEFSRSEFGTDIIVVGFSEAENWVEKMTRAIVANFFLAIHQEKLVVTVQDKEISKATLPGIIEQFKDARTIELKTIYEWYQALTAPDNGEPYYLSVLEDNDVALYLKCNEEYHNRVAYFRASGMRIRVAKPGSFQPFSAVVVVEKSKLNQVLRKAEPPRHNRWDAALIKNDPELRKTAQDSLEKMDGWLREELRKTYEQAGANFQDSGEGEYLPDEGDKSFDDQQGNDILRVHQTLLSSRPSNLSPGSMQSGSKPGTGEPVTGDVYGKGKRRKKKKGKTVVAGPGSHAGATPARGGAPLSAVNISWQKAFIINQQLGLWRVLLKPEQDYSNVTLSFYAIGEDNEEDLLTVEKYAYGSKTNRVQGKTIGPLNLRANEIAELFITFENKEKMRINIIAMGRV